MLDLVVAFLGGEAADVGVGAGAEPLRQLAADVDLRRRVAHVQRLDVGVDGDELDLADARVDHPVDGVEPGPADADDLDHGEIGAAVRARRAIQARPGLRERLDVAGRGRRLLVARRRRGHARRRRAAQVGRRRRLRRRARRHRLRRGRRRQRVGPRRRRDRGRRLGDLLLPARDVLDRSLLRLRLRGRGRSRRRHGCVLGSRLLLALLGLPLRRLGRAEQLRERALTHAGAPTRHRAPPWRGRGTCRPPPRSGRTSTPTGPSPAPPHSGQSCGSSC